MWACALGHVESALLLYRWRPQCLKMSDSLGRFPLDVAKSRGHTPLANALVQISQEDPRSWAPIGVSPPPSDPIQIPSNIRSHHNVPAFMVSSPATNTPSSSLSDDSAPLFDGHSPSSGCLSNLSISPSSHGIVSPNTGVSPQLSPRLPDKPPRSGAEGMLSIQQGFLRRDSSSSSGKSTSPHHHSSHSAFPTSSPQPGCSNPFPIPPPVSPSTLRAFLNGSQVLEGLDPSQLLGHSPKGDREQADTKEMWESFVKELQVAAQLQQQQEQHGEQHVMGADDGLDQRCDSPMQTDDYSLLQPRQAAGNKVKCILLI